MKITRKFALLAAGIIGLASVSCSKGDDTLRYNNATMGNVKDGAIISDQGNRFNIVDQTCEGKIDTMQRVFVVCDVLRNTEGASEKDYDIRLNVLVPVLAKDAVRATSITEGNELKNDPILLSNIWISGGYLNAYIMIPVKAGSKIKHRIDLEYDDLAQNDGSYAFTFRHDASGEVLTESNDYNMQIAYGYVSFPIASIIKEDNAKIKITWLSHKTDAGIIFSDIQEYTTELIYSNETYQHVPATEFSINRRAEIR
jgi:hypothetical protein